MEALAAISLAGNILQFVDFSSKVVAKGLEYRQSLTGRLKDHIVLESTIDDLDKLIFRLEHDAEVRGAPSSSDSGAALQRQLESCSEIGKNIRRALDKVKVDGSGRFKSYRVAFRAVWSQSDLETLRKRLSEVQQQMQLHLSVEEKEQLRSLCKHQDDLVLSLDQVGQRILNNVLEGRETLLVEQAVLSQQMKVFHEEEMNQMASGFSRLEAQMKSLALEVKTLPNDSTIKTDAINTTNIEDFINTLRFRSIDFRYENIDEAYADTLEWVLAESFSVEHLQDEAEIFLSHATAQLGLEDWEHEIWERAQQKEFRAAQKNPPDNLCQWLRNGQRTFWVWGKPGCGKSTLMKFLLTQDRYSELLEDWSHPYPLVIASFFFWKAGDAMQKSQVGLLQSLLHQILKKRPDLVPALFGPSYRSSYIARMNRNSNDEQATWALDELTHAFKGLQRQNVKICLHIDGLDEFEGRPRDLLALINKLTATENIKVLCAGRWERAYERAFSGSPSLAMHRLTWTALAQYTTDVCLADADLRTLMSYDPAGTKNIILSIVEKAEGVFLWVKLAIQSLIDGGEHFETTQELIKRLHELPGDIHELYQSILDGIDLRYQSDAAFWLLLLKCFNEMPNEDIKGLHMHFANSYDPQQSNIFTDISTSNKADIEHAGQLYVNQAQSRCPQFFSITSDPAGRPKIDFVHRSILDFLELPDTDKHLNSMLKDRPNPYLAASAGLAGYLIFKNEYSATPFWSTGAIDVFDIIIRNEKESRISFNPLRNQIWFYLVFPDRAQLIKNLSFEWRKEYYMVASNSCWVYSSVSQYLEAGGLLEPLLPFLIAYDTDYVLHRIDMMPRPPSDEEVFWALIASVSLLPGRAYWKRLPQREEYEKGLSQRIDRFEYFFEALTRRYYNGGQIPFSRRLWILYLDSLQGHLMQLRRGFLPYMRDPEIEFEYDRTLETVEVIVRNLCLSDAELNVLITPNPRDCDQTVRSPLALLHSLAACEYFLGPGVYERIDLAVKALKDRKAKSITRRPRRWTLPLPEQSKAFRERSHAHEHDGSPLQSRIGRMSFEHVRGALKPYYRMKVRSESFVNGLHRVSSTSCLRRTHGLEAQYICGSELRQWADLQHLLIERRFFHPDGFPTHQSESYSSFLKGTELFGLSHEEYWFARYGRSAHVWPSNQLIQEIFHIINAVSFEIKVCGRDLAVSGNLTLLDLLSKLKHALRESLRLLRGLNFQSAKYQSEASKLAVDTMKRIPLYKGKYFLEKNEWLEDHNLQHSVRLFQALNQQLLEMQEGN